MTRITTSNWRISTFGTGSEGTTHLRPSASRQSVTHVASRHGGWTNRGGVPRIARRHHRCYAGVVRPKSYLGAMRADRVRARTSGSAANRRACFLGQGAPSLFQRKSFGLGTSPPSPVGGPPRRGHDEVIHAPLRTAVASRQCAGGGRKAWPAPTDLLAKSNTASQARRPPHGLAPDGANPSHVWCLGGS